MKSITIPMKQILLALAFLSVVLTAVGCKNTAHGAGQDIENAGEKIQEKTQ
jgi:predicted small secreted protein